MNYEERPIHIIYYICINPDKEWNKIIQSQLTEMYNSGILESAVLHIEVCCEQEHNIKLVEEGINNFFNEKTNCIYFLTIITENNYEYQGISKLREQANSNCDKIFIYIHSKSMFYDRAIIYKDKLINPNPDDSVTFENKILTKYTFNNWKDTLNLFKEDGCELNKAALFPSNEGFCWYNFFWASGKYLKTCEEPIMYNKTPTNDTITSWPKGRFYYEIWLGTGDNSNGYVYNLLEDSYRGITKKEAMDDLHDLILNSEMYLNYQK